MSCALMESVFHDVPHEPGFKSVDKAKLANQQHSTIELTNSLELVDLTSVALRKLGIQRKQLIDTEKDQYPATRQWAEAVHLQCRSAQGLTWVSRQDDSARAYVFFGDRVPTGIFRPTGASRDLLDSPAYDEVIEMAERIGVYLVDGSA